MITIFLCTYIYDNYRYIVCINWSCCVLFCQNTRASTQSALVHEVEPKLEVVSTQVPIGVAQVQTVDIARKSVSEFSALFSVAVIPPSAETTTAAITCETAPTALLHPAATREHATAYIASVRDLHREIAQRPLNHKAPSVCA